MVTKKNYNQELVDWVRRQYGPEKRFGSPRSLSIAIGRNENQIARIEESGRASVEVLVDIARANGENPLNVFMFVGWLTEGEVNTGLTVDEIRFLEKWRRISLKDRQTLDEVAEGFLRSNEGSGPEPGHHQANSESG